MKRRRAWEGLHGILLLVIAGILRSCEGPVGPVPKVEYSGCWAVYLPGPVCVLRSAPVRSDPTLTLWVKTDPRSEVEIQAGDCPQTVQGEEAGDGRRFILSIPRGSSSLTVRLRPADGPRSAPWSLTLAPPEEPPWFAKVLQLNSSGKKEEVRGLLEHLRKVAPPKEQGLVLRSLAQLADTNDQAVLLEEGIAADRAANCLSGEIEKATGLARIYILEGRFNDARKKLTGLRISKASTVSKFQVACNEGLLAERTGDYRTALEKLESARLLEERVDIPQYRGDAEQLLAGVYQSLGRTKDALDLFARLRALPLPDQPCDLATLLTNEAWAQLRAREAGEQTPDPLPALQRVQEILDGNDCARPEQRLNARLNLSFAYQQANQWDKAGQVLDQARSLKEVQPNLNERLWWDDLEARAAIAEGQPERALHIYEDLDRKATAAGSPEGGLQALLGLAKAWIYLGRLAPAIDALAGADRLIDAQIWQIPVHEGRDTFLGQREEATRLYLQTLFDDGQWQRAFILARRARSRLLQRLRVRDRLAQLKPAERKKWDDLLSDYWTLRTAVDLQAAQTWQLRPDESLRAKDDQQAQLARAQGALDRALAFLGDPGRESLSPPGPGEVILVYHPLLKEKWAGFAATARGVEAVTFDLPPEALKDQAGLARKLLVPFRSAIAASERVRVLPYGPLRAVEFHALPFAGKPLLANHLVVYSLDLPVRAPAPVGKELMALLVSDPQGNLAGARDEAKTVAKAVGAWGSVWSLKHLGGLKAEARTVLQELPSASLFHYAGHGTFAGFAGWDSSLPLANNSRLVLGDLLALSRVPQWVVLSACDAGHSSEQAPGEGIGLANAFLLAGAQTVIASTQEVQDGAARDLLSELYQNWRPGEDLARQFHRAQLACLRRDPKADCMRFRLFEP